MALSAQFIADFSSFNQAVEKADIKLRDWDRDISGVAKRLSGMSDSFSGRKILQEASLAARAVEEIGGTAKLTEKEQARLNETVTEAIAKYKALGLEAPSDLKKIAKETDQTAGVFDTLKGKLSGIGGLIAGAFTVGAIVGATKKVIDFASTMEDLHAKTGISTTGLQELDLAFQGSGVSLDTVTSNVIKLSKNLIGGDKAAVGAMEKLGLQVSNLKNLSPEELFTTVADAVGKIQNPAEKAFAAMTIFGKGGAELLQGLDGHLAETTRKFEAMGVIIDEKTLKAADDFGDSMQVLERVGVALIANVIGPALPGLVAFAQWAGNAASATIKFAQGLEDWLIRKLFEANAAIRDWVVAIADASQKIPLLGKYIGVSAGTLDGLKESARQAHDTVKLFSEKVDVAGSSAKTATPALLGIGDAVETIGKSKAADAIQNLRDQLFGLDSIKGADNMVTALGGLENVAKLSAGEVKKVHQAMTDAIDAAKRTGREVPLEWYRIEDATRETTGSLDDYVKKLGTLPKVYSDIPEPPPLIPFKSVLDMQRTVDLMIANPPGVILKANKSGAEVAGSMVSGITAGLAGVGGAIQSALQGGGNVLKSVGSAFGGEFTKAMFGTKAFQESITRNFGTALGGMFNALLPGIGTLAGPLLSKIGSLFGHLIGHDEESKLVNPARDAFAAQFVQQFGGSNSDAVTKALEAAGLGGARAAALIAQFNTADTMQEFNAAKEDIEAALHSTDNGIQTVMDSTKDLNLQLSGSDEAIAALGKTQDQVTKTMLEGFDRLIAKLGEFIDRLGDASKGLASIVPPPPLKTPGEPIGTAPEPILEPEVFHKGGMVRWLHAHRGLNLAAGDVPIIAQTGERVLNRDETRAYNSGQGGAVHLHVQSGGIVVNGTGKNASQIAREIIPELWKQIGRFNTGGSKRRMGRAVGLRSAPATT